MVIIISSCFSVPVRSVLVPVNISLWPIGGIFSHAGFGFTINLLTLLSHRAVGSVRWHAIVVVEKRRYHLREGQSPIGRGDLGARELVGPIIAMTLTLIAVYTPIGLQGGP